MRVLVKDGKARRFLTNDEHWTENPVEAKEFPSSWEAMNFCIHHHIHRVEVILKAQDEETFLKDTEDRKILRTCLKEQADDISTRLKRRRLGAHTVQVKVRSRDFTTLTRQIIVEEPLTEARDIYRLGCFLLGREKLVSRPLRLLGLGVSSLRESTGQQLGLFSRTAKRFA